MSIITMGMSSGPLVTKGYGKTLVVIVPEVPRPIGVRPGGGILPYPIDVKFFEDIIETRTIKLPNKKDKISVEVLLIQYSDEVTVSAVLEHMKQKYEKVEVYLENEVELYD